MSRIIRHSAASFGASVLAVLVLAAPASAKPGPYLDHKTPVEPAVTVHPIAPEVFQVGGAALGGVVIGAAGVALATRSQRRPPRPA
jgi:hypothetical protein